MSSFRKGIIDFINSDKETPVLFAISAGLYPLLFYYYSNFTLLNSWEQFSFFILYFLVIPIIVFQCASVLINRFSFFKTIESYVFPILNFAWSAFLLVVVTKGFNYKYILVAVVLASFLGIIFQKHFKKIVVFQFMLAIIVAVPLFSYMFSLHNLDSWTNQPDDIEHAVFKHKPNIYFIQPDGYVNFSEIDKGFYKYDNSEFKNFLLSKNFKLYNNYRSNYFSTLSSNSSMFAMRHHYHNFPKSKIREVYDARNIIVGNNPVLKTLKNNNYKSFLFLDKSYMLINRPNVAFDYCNMQADELSYFSRGFQMSRDIFSDLKRVQNKSLTPSFYFLEELSPSHVTNKKSPGNIANSEREKYFERLEYTNNWLKDVIKYIENNDPNSLIIIAADHGGFVGMNTTLEARSKLTNRDFIYSIFSAQLAIKWPSDLEPICDLDIKTSVNLFRVLFSCLSENDSYLKYLQENISYIQIDSGAPFGVYEYINEEGEVVFNKVSKKSFQ